MKSKILLILTSSCLLAGCGVTDKVNAEGPLELNYCESQTDLNTTMLLSASSSRLTLDGNIKTQGNYSAKLEVVSTPHYSSQTTFYQSLRNVAKGIDYTNFNNYSAIKFDVYNGNDVTKSISVSCVTRNSFQHGQDTHQTKVIQLPSKSWTNVTYTIDKSDAGITVIDGAKYISGFDIIFLKASSASKPDVYYLDNFTVE